MKVLDLFSGIGGFSLGLERAGMQTVAFCEIDPYCRAVLRKHWPDVPVYEDVRTIPLGDLPNSIDLICGGFPCQDISLAGKGAGLAGHRSGLWTEFARVVRQVRPRFVVVENVSALRNRGLDRVLGDLAAIGYDAEWHCVPASAVGAPHRRDRLFVVGHTVLSRLEGHAGSATHADSEEGNAVADGSAAAPSLREDVADAACALRSGSEIVGPDRWAELADGSWWHAEPDVGRVAHGVSRRVDRLRSLGNAVVPQVAEVIGLAIMELGERKWQ